MAKKKKTREKDVAVPLEPLKPMVEIDGVQVEIPEHVIQANMPPAPRFRVKIRSPEHHVNQLIFCRSPLKRKIVRAGRRGGKTTGAAILAVEAFVKGKRVLYAAPTIDQVKKFWKEVCRSLEEPIAYSQLYKNETEHIIEQRGSERRIRAKTAFNAETLRGDYADLLILDEWQLMDETAWTEVGAPMLIDNNGDVVFIYTPPSLESRSASKARDPQHAAKMFKEHKDDPLWLCIHFPSSDNPYISREGLEEVSKNMSAMAFRQEILAEDTDEIPGALWTRKIIEDSRVKSMPCVARRIVIAIDPSGGNTTEVGIMAGAEGEDGEFYVLEDGSMVTSRPKEWATKSVNMYYRHMADRIIGERNYGGDMIEETLRNVDENVSYKDVNASRGKLVRAEPVLALFQNKKMHLVGHFPELEDEMCVIGSTLISTASGAIPVWQIQVGDQVYTRQGLCRVSHWRYNGVRNTVVIQTSNGRLQCTPNHPIFVVGKGFIRADNVSRRDRVLICPFQSNDHSSFSVTKNISCDLTAIMKQAGRRAIKCFTAKNGKSYVDLFREVFTFITTKRDPITEYGISGALALAFTNGFTESVGLLPNHRMSKAKNENPNGPRENHTNASVENVVQSSSPQASTHGTANRSARVELAVVENVKPGTRKPVFNLSVEQDEEYFANGILTHNCSYTAQPGQKSPNRMDAMVWCGIELSGAGSLGLLDFYKSGRAQAFMGRKPVAMTPIMGARDVAGVATNDQTPKCPSCKDAMIGLIAGGQMRCRACGHQWWKDGPPVIQKIGGRRMLELEK